MEQSYWGGWICSASTTGKNGLRAAMSVDTYLVSWYLVSIDSILNRSSRASTITLERERCIVVALSSSAWYNSEIV